MYLQRFEKSFDDLEEFLWFFAQYHDWFQSWIILFIQVLDCLYQSSLNNFFKNVLSIFKKKLKLSFNIFKLYINNLIYIQSKFYNFFLGYVSW